MSETKIPHIASKALVTTAQRIGLVVMGAAMAFSVLDLADEAKRIVLPTQPVLVGAENNSNDNQLRREREETAPHFISYSEVQRTPSRSGRG